jgi:hypothetical protein
LPAQEIADDRLTVRFGDVGLDEGAAELPEVIDHQVDGRRHWGTQEPISAQRGGGELPLLAGQSGTLKIRAVTAT